MDKIKSYIKNNSAGIFLLLIILTAIFVRTYHFQPWLYFKMDQSRDANLISQAIEDGPGYLPLLGPRAGATEVEKGYLRLGPAFYYFQYISGKLFHSIQPDVLAYPDLFFSIAVLPLLYIFLRLYFSRKNSLLVLAMYAFSFLVIQYSRFSWNPNSLPFFLILSFYGLLRFLNSPDSPKKYLWVGMWSAGMAIGSQLHFFGFFSLVGTSGLLILWHYKIWKKEILKNLLKREYFKKLALYAGMAILVFIIIYTPVIVSEVMTKGENSKNFIDALGSKAEKKPLLDKIRKDLTENIRYYCLITTSDCYQSDLKKDIFPIVLTGLILVAGLLLAIKKLLKKIESNMQGDFLRLFLIWTGMFLVLTIPVSFQLRPRFFIVVFAIPFISLGMIYQFLEEKYGRKLIVFSFLATAGIMLYNAQGTAAWFSEQKKSQTGGADIERTLILKAKDGVTLGQLEGVANYIYGKHRAGANVYYYVKPEHVAPIRYLLELKKDPNMRISPLKVNDDPNAQYFAVVPSENELDSVYAKYKHGTFNVLSSAQFGQLKVFEIDFNNRKVSSDFKFKTNGGSSDRVFWKDVFGF
jgi:hypothetical protein